MSVCLFHFGFLEDEEREKGGEGWEKQERDVRKEKTLIPCPPPQKGPTPNPYMRSG
jgi:hypothetical protein